MITINVEVDKKEPVWEGCLKEATKDGVYATKDSYYIKIDTCFIVIERSTGGFDTVLDLLNGNDCEVFGSTKVVFMPDAKFDMTLKVPSNLAITRLTA